MTRLKSRLCAAWLRVLCPAALIMISCLATGCEMAELPEGGSGQANSGGEIPDLRNSTLVGDTTSYTPANIESQPAIVETRSVFLASFNVQVFGQSKLQDEKAMQILIDLARRVDVLAIQEIRSANQNLLPEFLNRINSDGSQYRYVLGPRLGRTKSKEQYAFIYDATRIEQLGPAFTVADPKDEFHREPFVARFQVRTSLPDPPFSFTLINMHTDPDEADMEVDALAGVYQQLQKESEEDDIFLLGDLNVDDEHLGLIAKLPGVETLIRGVSTNTRGTKTYDHFILNPGITAEFTGNSGVVDIQTDYGLSIDDALEVSDHLPIWAEFNSFEATPTHVASGQSNAR